MACCTPTIAAFPIATATGGNGFIAAFVGGLAFGSGGPGQPGGPDADGDDMAGQDEAEHLAEFTEDAAELLGAVTFFAFGNLFIDEAIRKFSGTVLVAALASLTVVRMLPVALALTRSGCSVLSKVLVGWFGPRGLASIVFGILLLEELEEMSGTADQLVGVISVTVMLSVVLHGATAAVGARLYGARTAATDVDTGIPDAVPRSRWAPSRRAGGPSAPS